MSSPSDEDGFQSVAWDDAPPRAERTPSTNFSSSGADTPLSEGFEDISTASPTNRAFSPQTPTQASWQMPESSSSGAGQGRDQGTSLEAAREGGHLTGNEWGDKWMSIEVYDPTKEHEGSKDMFVSYAVRTKVSLVDSSTHGSYMRDGLTR